jgi:hypothetical protein
MFVVGKEADTPSAKKAGDRFENLLTYPWDKGCVWLGWDGDTPEDLKISDVRVMVVYTLEKELKLWREKPGVSYNIPDDRIHALIASITGKGPLWWKKYGHDYIRHGATNSKGFA